VSRIALRFPGSAERATERLPARVARTATNCRRHRQRAHRRTRSSRTTRIPCRARSVPSERARLSPAAATRVRGRPARSSTYIPRTRFGRRPGQARRCRSRLPRTTTVRPRSTNRVHHDESRPRQPPDRRPRTSPRRGRRGSVRSPRGNRRVGYQPSQEPYCSLICSGVGSRCVQVKHHRRGSSPNPSAETFGGFSPAGLNRASLNALPKRYYSIHEL
jgi:hypothetical protein